MAEHIDGPLYYETMGKSGPVMAFVHPNPMDQSCWIFQMAQMSIWYRCIAIDLSGYGRSPKARAGLTMQDIAQACWEAIEESVAGGSAADYGRRLEEEAEKWGKVIRSANMQLLDVHRCRLHGRFRLIRTLSRDDRRAEFDPNVWSGRALQENFHRVGGCAVLHQCIRPLTGAFYAPGHHGYQRACDLISGQASTGHLGHQCWHAPGRPILHLVSHPLADLGR